MEIDLHDDKIKALWSVGTLIVILLVIDLVLRIYVNYKKIKDKTY
jgi:hypothetical protein